MSTARRESHTRFLSLALLAAGFAPAQDSPPASRIQSQPDQNQNSPSAQDPEAPPLTYNGPSLFGTDQGLLTQRSGKLIDLEIFGQIAGVYDSALAAPPQNGSIRAVGDSGIEYGVGVIAARRWRHAKLSVEYRGKFIEYQKYKQFNGSDQFLDLDYSQWLRPHLTLSLKEIAGTTTNANGAFSYLPISAANAFAIPTNELFNVRTNYAESRVDLVWQKSARLSFDVGGDGFVLRRDDLALAGLSGYSARAAAAYRLTRRQTLGASLQYMHFDFQRVYGSAQIQTAALAYSVALTRTMDLQLQAGGSRIDTTGLTQVTLDPSVAAIVGQSVATVTFSRVLLVPLADARVVRRFEHASVNAGFTSGVSPGNGIYLTSRQSTANSGLSYTGAHRLTAAVTASYSRLSTLGQSLPPYTNLQGGGGLTYRIAGSVYAQLRYDYRHYSTQYLLYKIDSNRISIGMAFSPGAAPLSIW
jgi:hypothetical protein